MKKLILIWMISLGGSFLFSSCATYYQKTQKFQQYVADGQIEKAENWLKNDKKGKKNRNLLLHHLNYGTVTHMLKKYEESNRHFAQADRIIEDQIKNYGQEALALITNPSIKPYQAEDFEKVLLHYYMAMNYIKQNQYSEAIVECRRINIKLNKLNDKYKDHKNKYQRDAFAHNLMGMVYEANGDYNNAFIAYRNAFEVYEQDYEKHFNLSAPDQLKKDIVRSAYKTGFFDEVDFYEKKFNIQYTPDKSDDGELIFIWLNGFAPVKSEWSINFTVMRGDEGWVTFVNDDLGLSFPFYYGNYDADSKNALSSLSMTRVAFPKYLERPPVYQHAYVKYENQHINFEIGEDINQIAFKTLRDRMLRELGTALLRLATKKALEKAVASQNEGAGAALSIVNAVTEKADTRNWQTLPYSVNYLRIRLPAGKQSITFSAIGDQGMNETREFVFEVPKNKIIFFSYHTLDSYPPIN